jgi:hypothetical protein
MRSASVACVADGLAAADSVVAPDGAGQTYWSVTTNVDPEPPDTLASTTSTQA